METIRHKYDIVFDTTSTYSIWKGSTWLKPKGTIVMTVPTLESVFTGWFCHLETRKNVGIVHVEPKKDDLDLVGKWMTDGSLKIGIDSAYKISDIELATDCHLGSKNGRVVIQVEGGW
jgi:NADPH:quinone reductase-like Zn-dependent oxidoreductase